MNSQTTTNINATENVASSTESTGTPEVAVAQVVNAVDIDDDEVLTFVNHITSMEDMVLSGSSKKAVIEKKWILLDSEATRHIFRNKKNNVVSRTG